MQVKTKSTANIRKRTETGCKGKYDDCALS